jgi:hypothetical protein
MVKKFFQLFILLSLSMSLASCSLLIGKRQCSPYKETVWKNVHGISPNSEQIASCNLTTDLKVKQQLLQYCQTLLNSDAEKDHIAWKSCDDFIATGVDRGPWNDSSKIFLFGFTQASKFYQECMNKSGYVREETGRTRHLCYRTSPGLP